jgi:dynein heavy chain 1, cytosolic
MLHFQAFFVTWGCVARSEGFQTAPTLARKVVHVLRAAEQLLSRQPNYDFGMRALKSILLAAGAALRGSSSKNDPTEITCPDAEAGNQQTGLQELTSFARTLHEMMLPKLTSADALVVQGIIQVSYLSTMILARSCSNVCLIPLIPDKLP